MPRSTAAYLADIIEACAAVEDVLRGIDLQTYQQTRSIRSSVERELILIGEAVSVLGRTDPASYQRISHARLIIWAAEHPHARLPCRGRRDALRSGWLGPASVAARVRCVARGPRGRALRPA